MTSFRINTVLKGLAIFLLITITGLASVAQRRESGGARQPAPRPTSASRATPAATPRPEPNKIPVAAAEQRIGAHVKYIEQRAGGMVAAYYYTGGQRTLEAAFQSAGVSRKSMTYADPWGKAGLGLFWSEHIKVFYAYHLEVLNKSLRIIRTQGFATKSDLEYLDQGMEAWKQYEQGFTRQFQTIVALYTKSALIGDEKEGNEVKYGSRMSQISNTRPFNAFAYDAVKAEWQQANKLLDGQNNQVTAELEKTKSATATMATEHLFTTIDAKPRIETGTAIGANENERP